MPPAVPRVRAGVLHPAGMSSPLVKNRTPPRPLSCLRSCTVQTTEPPASAIEGSRGELRVRPAAHQIDLSPTFPCTYSSSPTYPPPPQSRHLAGTAVKAATAAGRRRPPRRPSPCPNQAQESTPRDPRVVPRPRPAGPSRLFAGIWPDRRRPVPRDPIASP
jgi:hypothetical protein